jgi:hypothetical protein
VHRVLDGHLLQRHGVLREAGIELLARSPGLLRSD